MAELALHRFKGVMHDLGQWLMGPVIHLFLFRDQFVTGRHGDIDPHPKRVAFFMSMIRLLNRDIAAADMIAKFIESRRLLADHFLDPIRFHQTAITDIHRQLHKLTLYTLEPSDAKLRDTREIEKKKSV